MLPDKFQSAKPGITGEIVIVLFIAVLEDPPYELLSRDRVLVPDAGDGAVVPGSAVHRGLRGSGRPRNEPRRGRRSRGLGETVSFARPQEGSDVRVVHVKGFPGFHFAFLVPPEVTLTSQIYKFVDVLRGKLNFISKVIPVPQSGPKWAYI